MSKRPPFYDKEGYLTDEFKEWVLDQDTVTKHVMLSTLKDKRVRMFFDLFDLLSASPKNRGGMDHADLWQYLADDKED